MMILFGDSVIGIKITRADAANIDDHVNFSVVSNGSGYLVRAYNYEHVSFRFCHFDVVKTGAKKRCL